ncbi:glycosyltransferase family 39 protein [Pseudomonas sp. SCB32]|uniref:ArnT family glycosyltransferase n=1 Tax=Pseudomonas sp. SCB32 TaxID=2653853 RepID=UPI0012645482|nr:glycosyltransferase family 39 protein [Pseudomonas sp. SCB32]
MDGLTRQVAKSPCWSIFSISLVMLLGLQYKPAILNYTTRLVDFTQYMLYNGMTLFPIADDLQPYPDYTIANTFLEYLFSLPFGRVSILSMGLPICMAASLMLVFVYKLGALHDKKWGLYGVVFSLFTWAFLDGVTYLALDVYPALFTVVCFYLAYTADLKQAPYRLAFVFVALALGFTFRGPVGLIGPSIVVASYYALSKQWRTLLVFLLFAGLTLMAGVALLAWAAYLQGGNAFMQDVLEMQGLGRIANTHAPRYYFYFSAGLLTYGVTVVVALNVIVKKYKQFLFAPRQADTALLFYLASWFVALLIFFTIPNSKKARYILSITPAIALLAAYVFVDKEGVFVRVRERFLKFCLNIHVIGLGMLLIVFLYELYIATPLQPNYLGVLSSSVALALGRYVITRNFSEHPYREFFIVAFGLVAFFSLDAFLFNSITYHLELSVEPTPKFLPYWLW